MRSFEGRRALVTGASGGIGEALARRLARERADLLLVARTKERLRAVARALQKEHGVRAAVVAKDLARPGGPEALFRETQRRGLRVDVLVNNAGFGMGGPFAEAPLERALEMIQLNVAALVALTRLYLPGMIERGEGAIVNVASTAAFQPVPHMAAYAATKAFVLSFSEALHEECREPGVTVLALCPGATATAFWDVARLDQEKMPLGAQTAEEVAEAAIEAVRARKGHVVSGLVNSALARASRLVPLEMATRIAGILVRRSSTR